MAVLLGSIGKLKTYSPTKELVVIGATKKAKSQLKTPIIKVRISRGKSYDPNKIIKNESDAAKYFREYMNKNKIEGQEQFLVMYLARGLQILGIYPHSIGGMTSSVVDPKVIVATGITILAESAITAHNHPSGSLTPSSADESMAKNLKQAFSAQGIDLIDNLILTKNLSRSF
jgi:DNA repair protein RadC